MKISSATVAYFLPGRVKDLSAPLYKGTVETVYGISSSQN